MKRTQLLFAALIFFSTLYTDETENPSINPSAGPKVQDWSDFYLTGSFIWWIPNLEGLAFAQNGRATSSAGVSSHGHEKEVDFDFSAGLKIGAGLNFRYDGWDIYANYTWLYPSSRSGAIDRKNETGGLQSLWLIPVTSQADPVILGLSRGAAKWTMHFNVLDTELGRNFFISSKLTLRPFVGFKAAWVNQDYDVHYTVADASFAFSKVDLDMDQKFTGFGIRAGMNSGWQISDWWSIFSDFSFSEMWCEYDIRRKDRTELTSGTRYISYHSEFDFHTLNPVLELDLGLRYTHDFKDGKWRLTLQGAWEEQVWFSFNQFLNPESNNEGNLTIQGATARLGFAF